MEVVHELTDEEVGNEIEEGEEGEGTREEALKMLVEALVGLSEARLPRGMYLSMSRIDGKQHIRVTCQQLEQAERG